jgi:hypothetical protein
MAYMRWMLLVLAMGGCVHEGDLASWRGVPTRALLVHPLFSTLPRTVQPIGGGEELWTYSNCGSAPVVCSPAFGNVVCTGGGAMCCHNQFMVRGDTVEGYRVAGRCRTNCSVRPGGSCDAGPVTAAGR